MIVEDLLPFKFGQILDLYGYAVVLEKLKG